MKKKSISSPKSRPTKPARLIKVGHVTVAIYESRNHGRLRFRVNYYADGPGTPRRARTFADLAQAEHFASVVATREAQHRPGISSPAELSALMSTLNYIQPRLDQLGISHAKAMDEFLEAKSAAPNLPLGRVVREYMALPWVTKATMPWHEAVEEFLASKQCRGVRPQTLRILRNCLLSWPGNLASLPIGNVTAQQLDRLVHRPDRSRVSNRKFYSCCHNFFTWLKRNGYLRADLPSAMDLVLRPEVHASAPSVITAATARQALQVLVANGSVPDTLAFALGLFSGLRVNEIARLEMNDILPGEQITVPAHQCMTRFCRSMPLLPVLHAWLAPFYGREGRLIVGTDPIVPIIRALRLQGLAWQRNWLRHSFITYRLAATHNPVQTALECGHSPATLQHHYLQLVTADQAAEYFALTPEACGITDWPERVQAFFALQPRASSRKPRLHPASPN